MTYGHYANGNYTHRGTLPRPLSNQILQKGVYYNLELRVEAASGTVAVKLLDVDLGTFSSHFPVVGSGGYATQNGHGSQTEGHFRKYVLA